MSEQDPLQTTDGRSHRNRRFDMGCRRITAQLEILIAEIENIAARRASIQLGNGWACAQVAGRPAPDD